MKFAIFDIDNCIADDSWRTNLIKFDEPDLDKRYHEYHMACEQDDFCNRDVYVDALKTCDAVLFVTSRPIRYFNETSRWLNANVPMPKGGFVLRMRGEGDHRRSVDVKRDHVLAIPSTLPGLSYSDVAFAYDDRPDVVEMYRAFGFPAAVLAIKPADLPEPPAKGPDHYLRQAAETFATRNAQYGSCYQRSGELIRALFHNGIVPSMSSPEELTRFNLLLMCAGKLQRYAHNFKNGGHQDSARDLQVYAAMLEEHTKQR